MDSTLPAGLADLQRSTGGRSVCTEAIAHARPGLR